MEKFWVSLFLWWFAFVSLGLALFQFRKNLNALWMETALEVRVMAGAKNEQTSLVQFGQQLLTLQEMIQSGVFPEPESWDRLKSIPHPIAQSAHYSFQEIRSQGGELLPTLNRFLQLSEFQRESAARVRSQTAQAMTQAMICVMLIPGFSWGISYLLPEIRGWAWTIGVGVALILGILGGYWIWVMADRAKWGNLPRGKRSWILGVLVSGERLMAWIRSGLPQDLAWTQSVQSLSSQSIHLAETWGFELFSKIDRQRIPVRRQLLENRCVELGSILKESLAHSLMEGKPCLDRLESILDQFKKDIEHSILREISLLPTRTLKPLFICVAPAIGILVFSALFLVAHESLGIF